MEVQNQVLLAKVSKDLEQTELRIKNKIISGSEQCSESTLVRLEPFIKKKISKNNKLIFSKFEENFGNVIQQIEDFRALMYDERKQNKEEPIKDLKKDLFIKLQTLNASIKSDIFQKVNELGVNKNNLEKILKEVLAPRLELLIHDFNELKSLSMANEEIIGITSDIIDESIKKKND